MVSSSAAYLWVNVDHVWGAVGVMVFMNQTIVVLMAVAWDIQAEVGGSVGCKLVEWARDLKLLIDNLQRNARKKRRKEQVESKKRRKHKGMY